MPLPSFDLRKQPLCEEFVERGRRFSLTPLPHKHELWKCDRQDVKSSGSSLSSSSLRTSANRANRSF